MNYYYYQLEGGNEPWKPVPESHLAQFTQDAMFVTVLSVDSPIADEANKEQLNGVKYSGPLYFDLDDAESPASTAIDVVELIAKLQDLQVNPYALRIFATGGKGFHVLVSPNTFLTKAPAKGLPLLPIIFKEIAYKLAVKSLDLRVYTARKGRMFRQPNIERPNGKYKVPVTYDTLVQMAELAKTDHQAAREQYDQLCSAPSDYHFIEEENPVLAPGLMAMFDECKTKVQSMQRSRKVKPVRLPEHLPSFEMLLRGEGIKPDVGFHQIALQAAITAHATGMPLASFLANAAGLCENHDSDGYRYNTPSKRRAELARMFDYTEDNPCYEYSAGAVGSLLTHPAMDMRGVEMTEDEVLADMEFGMDEYSDEYEHAGLTLTASGAYVATEHGQKRILAMGFEDVTEMVSADTGSVSTVSASVKVGGKAMGVKVMDLANFNSVANMNKMVMPLGQAFMGNDNHARGLYMRLVEKARKGKRRMYALSREGLDYINLPFHEKEELRNDFLVWGDCERVITQPNVAAAEVNFKFIGFPMERGQFQTDLSQAPPLVEWLSDPENKERMRRTMHALFSAQDPSYYGKIIGWMIACMYRMMFHKAYSKFPLLHVNGAAGAGKCLAKDTPVLMADGTVKMVQDVVVGDKLLGPDGQPRNVLSLARGRETMYKVIPTKGDSYTVNESHILSLKKSDRGNLKLADGVTVPNGADVVNVNVKTWYDSDRRHTCKLKGWRSDCVEFHKEPVNLPVDPYWFGAWLGDGNAHDVAIYKPRSGNEALIAWLEGYAEAMGMKVTEYAYEGKCSGWAIVNKVSGQSNVLRQYVATVSKTEGIPTIFKAATVAQRKALLAGLMDTDGSVDKSGFDFTSKYENLANDVAFVARSLGLSAYVSKQVKGIKATGFEGTYYRVSISGECSEVVPTLVKKPAPRAQVKRHRVHGITVEKLGVDDYYGFTLDGDHLFLLGDFTVTHNTEGVKLLTHFHYFRQEPKMLTPTSTLFAVQYAASGSASIPLVLDEFKPSEMDARVYDRFKLLLRDAYNCRNVERGGGTRDNADYRAVHQTALSAPICFIAEAAESESALMERVVLLTLIKPPVVQAQKYLRNFIFANDNRDVLGIIGNYMAAQIVKRYSIDMLKAEFSPIYNDTRMELMLQDGEERTLSGEQLRMKLAAKERTVFNYAVVRFGLARLENLLQAIFDDEFTETFQAMRQEAVSSVNDLQTQTIPEWLKVMNTFADLAKHRDDKQYALMRGEDYAFLARDGKECIEFYARSCYNKYRIYCGLTRTRPLYPSEAAFIHALNAIPALVERNSVNGELSEVPGGSHIFDLDTLRGAGFVEPR